MSNQFLSHKVKQLPPSTLRHHPHFDRHQARLNPIRTKDGGRKQRHQIKLHLFHFVICRRPRHQYHNYNYLNKYRHPRTSVQSLLPIYPPSNIPSVSTTLLSPLSCHHYPLQSSLAQPNFESVPLSMAMDDTFADQAGSRQKSSSDARTPPRQACIECRRRVSVPCT